MFKTTNGEHLTDYVEEGTPVDKPIKTVQVLEIPMPKKNETWDLFFVSLERAFKHKNVAI